MCLGGHASADCADPEVRQGCDAFVVSTRRDEGALVGKARRFEKTDVSLSSGAASDEGASASRQI